jgi:hypothetical protein
LDLTDLMDKFDSQKEHALHLAKRGLELLTTEDCNTSTVLRICYSVSSLIGDSENRVWINSELNGYKKEDIGKALSKRRFTHKPPFRNNVSYFDVTDSIHRIHHSVKLKNPLTVWDNSMTDSIVLPVDWCHTILATVQDNCLVFLLNTITKIEYENKIDSLVESIQKTVNKKLMDINQEITNELQSISNNFNHESPAERSKAIHSCRRLLKFLADEAYPPKEEPFIDNNGKEHKLGDNAYMNRLLAFVAEKEKSLTTTQIPLLASHLDKLRETLGEGEHAEISKFETQHVILQTYLIISRILSLMG